MQRWTILVLVTMLALPAQKKADPAEVRFEEASKRERVDGDLKAALAIYARLAQGSNRVVAAKALIRVGQCHEKLGSAEARKAYERAVREFADQADIVAQARQRLSALGTGGAGESNGLARARVIWDNPVDTWGRVTRDGRYLSFVDWSTGDLAVRDLQIGQHRRVTNKGGYKKAEGEAESTSISPDGKRIVFNWQRWDKAAQESQSAYELHIVNTDGSGERVLIPAGRDKYFEPYSWSPDQKWVALSWQDSMQGKGKLALVSPDTGELRLLETGTPGNKSNIEFSPDGKWIAWQESVSGIRTRNIFMLPSDGSAKNAVPVVEDATMMGWSPDGGSIICSKKHADNPRLLRIPVAAGKPAGSPVTVPIPLAENTYPLGVNPKGDFYYSSSNTQSDGWLMRPDPVTGVWPKSPIAIIPLAPIGYANNLGNSRFSPDGKHLALARSPRSIAVRTMASGQERIIAVNAQELRRFEWMPDGSGFVATALGEKGLGIYRIDGGTGMVNFVAPLDAGYAIAVAADGKSVYHFSRRGLEQIDLASGASKDLVTGQFGGQGPPNMRLSKDGGRLVVNTMANIWIYELTSGQFRRIFERGADPLSDRPWTADWSADGNRIHAIIRPDPNNGKVHHLRTFDLVNGSQSVIPLPGGFQDFSISADGIHVAATQRTVHAQVWVAENILAATR